MGEERNEPNNVSWLPFNVLRGLKQNFICEKSQKTKIPTRDKKNNNNNKKGRREAPAPNKGKAYPQYEIYRTFPVVTIIYETRTDLTSCSWQNLFLINKPWKTDVKTIWFHNIENNYWIADMYRKFIWQVSQTFAENKPPDTRKTFGTTHWKMPGRYIQTVIWNAV